MGKVFMDLVVWDNSSRVSKKSRKPQDLILKESLTQFLMTKN
jgi:hypothetical protein